MKINNSWIYEYLESLGISKESVLEKTDIQNFSIEKRELSVFYLEESVEKEKIVDVVDIFSFQTQKPSKNFEKLDSKTNEHLLSKWILDSVEHLMKNKIALEVYENTLSHKLSFQEDWTIDIRWKGPNEKGWEAEWIVDLIKSKQRIEGTYTITFPDLIAECMKAGLSR